MIRPIRLIAPLAVTALATIALAAPSGSVAASTKTCKLSVPASEKLGPSYVTYSPGKAGFRVRGTTCAKGKKLIKAFHSCRYKKGKSGKCTSKVKGYKCTEKRPASLKGPFSFEGDVTCKAGSKKITHHYQQDS